MVDIGYNHNPWNQLGFFPTDDYGMTIPGRPIYLFTLINPPLLYFPYCSSIIWIYFITWNEIYETKDQEVCYIAREEFCNTDFLL